MTLYENLRSQLTTSIKEQNNIRKGILRVVLGDISTLEANRSVTEDDIKKIIKKLIIGNTETLKFLKQEDSRYSVLVEENHILNSFLPQLMTKNQIKDTLKEIDFSSVKSEGQAVGIAIKYLKSNSLEFDSKDVILVVKEILA